MDLTRLILCSLLFVTTPALAQQDQDVLILDDDFVIDDSFGFDDSLFGDPFRDPTEGREESFWDDFTVRISQQLFGQVNTHSVTPLPGLTLSRPAELENNRLGINVRYQNPFAAGWLFQASGQTRVYWPDDYEYEANDDRIDTEFRVNEFFLQRSFESDSFKFGRQTVVWGETVGNSVLDIINTSEFRDFTIIDIEDARLNQWMLVWDHFTDNNGSFSTFINLYPEFNPAPVRGSPFYFDQQFNLTDYDRDDELLFEIGTQWRMSFEGSDIALMAAYLYENQLRYEDPLDPGGDAVAKKNDFFLIGFSANRAIGRLLLNFDLAFSHDVLASGFNFPGASSLGTPVDLKKDRIGTSFGFEWAIDNEQNLSLGIQAQRVLDEDEGLLPGQELFNEGIFGNWLVRYSNSLQNGDLILSSTLQGDLEGDSALVQIAIDYTVNDNWSVNAQIISITANNETPLVLFDEDVRVGTTVTYSF